MLEVTAFAYSLLATFVLSSARRNRASQRCNALILDIFGNGLMAFSFAMAFLLFGLALVRLIFDPAL
jgi:hypothetical protein